MNTIKYLKPVLLVGALCITGSSCNDSFLERYPETSITEENFFRTSQDLETYTNGLYDLLSVSYNDIYSDNLSTYTGSSETDNMLRGKLNIENVGGWDKWGDLRSINFLLANAGRAEGNAEDIDHYVGIARFFRAQFYYDQVKKYGDVPWISKPLKTDDEELLFKTQDPRTLVVDSIMADLQYAVDHIKTGDSRTRITQYAAYQLMARIALHEGTFRKYHTELNLTATADALLEKAAWAAKQLMDTDLFEITGTGAQGYCDLFSSPDLSSNKEMILYDDYSRELNRGNNTSSVYDWQWALSKSLADSYLNTDGSRPTDNPAYKTTGYPDMFTGRDERMAETIMAPGFTKDGDKQPSVARPAFGGLIQIKFYPRSLSMGMEWAKNYTDLPVFRYGETLLIYAEAKAELNQIDQPVIDLTVNALRKRAKVAALTLAGLTADPVLAAQYPNVTGPNQAVILEIRRERRVELACEGFRYDDLMRWKAGKLLEGPSEGIYVSGLGAYDVTGDGKPDVAILNSPSETGPIASLPEEVQKGLSKYYLHDESGNEQDFYLSEGTYGNIRFVNDKTLPRTFVDPQYYYKPIPKHQMQLNPNLVQPAGW